MVNSTRNTRFSIVSANFVRYCYKFWNWLFFSPIIIFTAPPLINGQTRKLKEIDRCGWHRRLQRAHYYMSARFRLKSDVFLRVKKFSFSEK